jgi:SAM-dependent methyltransferase
MTDVVANWSEDLEALHQEVSRDHAIEVLTRTVMLDRLASLKHDAIVADVGCSTGYLLDDALRRFPRAVGFDLTLSGLRHCGGRAAQADVIGLPLGHGSVDGILSANLLEHVPDDHGALAEIRRVLRPGGLAVLVVPAGPGVYDYYDRFLHHERRYARHELATKALGAGFVVVEDTHIGCLVYPPFWAVKKINRIRFDDLKGDALRDRVDHDYRTTNESKAFAALCRLEAALHTRHVQLPVGIRSMTVIRRPEI